MRKSFSRPIFVILFLFFVAHLISVVLHPLQWDSVIIKYYFHTDTLYTMLTEQGAILSRLIYAVMPFYSPVIIAAFIFGCYLVSSIVIYKTLLITNRFTRYEAMISAVYFSIYPACDSAYDLVLNYYALTLMLFYVAFYILFLGAKKQNPYPFLIGAGAVFFLSFSLQSLLVFFYGVFFGFILLNFRSNSSYVWKSAWLMLLPPFFYFLKRNVFHPFGHYQEYNQIHFSFRYTVVHLIQSAQTVTVDRLFLLTTYPKIIYFILFFLLLVVLLVAIFRPDKPKEESRLPVGPVAAFSLLLLLVALLPYVVVYKPPGLKGFMTRNAFLVALPVSLLLLQLYRVIGKRSGKIAVSIFCILVSLFLSAQLYTKIKWYSRSEQLVELGNFISERSDSIARADFVLVEDNANYGYGGIRDYEINYLLRKAGVSNASGFLVPKSYYGREDSALIGYCTEVKRYGEDGKKFFLVNPDIHFSENALIIRMAGNYPDDLSLFLNHFFRSGIQGNRFEISHLPCKDTSCLSKMIKHGFPG